MLCCLSGVCPVSVYNLRINYYFKKKKKACHSFFPVFPLDIFQYWRLYLLTLVLGIGGSFQFGMQVSVIASPAVVQSLSLSSASSPSAL